mmetsp:Transcript_21385/g.48167  ORF Transcript_21385/g.48167 Transcript_21385/m.48167 type:complete len:92 (+) Transcript_21385:1533-1808(+)
MRVWAAWAWCRHDASLSHVADRGCRRDHVPCVVVVLSSSFATTLVVLDGSGQIFVDRQPREGASLRSNEEPPTRAKSRDECLRALEGRELL